MKTLLSAFLISGAFAFPATAVTTISLDNVAGKWVNPVGGHNVAIDNASAPFISSLIRWSIPSDLNMVLFPPDGVQSLYEFIPNGALPGMPYQTGELIPLGDLQHGNLEVHTNGQIEQVELEVTYSVTASDGVATATFNDLTSKFVIYHDETSNYPSGGVCPGGGAAPCGDVGVFMQPVEGATAFSFGGLSYTLKLATDDMSDRFTFETPEFNFREYSIGLIATGETSAVVPLPASLLLLASGLGMFGAMRLRR